MPNYDDILDQYAKQREMTAAPTPMNTTDKYGAILDNMANQRDQKFAISVGNAVKGSPERAAEAQRIAKELNLSPAAVEANFDNALITYKQRMLDKQRAAQDDPILAMQFTNPDFAKIAHDDWWNLSTAGKVMRWFREIPDDLVKGFEAGSLQYDQSKLALQEMQSGVVMPDVRKRLKEMDLEIKGLKGSGGIIEEAFKVIGLYSQTLPRAAEFGSAAGITAGGVGLAMGPGAPVAAPVAAGTAFGVGFMAKMAEEMYGVEGGAAYKEMIDEGVSPDTARLVGAGVGSVNSLLEMTGMHIIAAPFKKALIKETTQQIAESLAKPTMRAAVAEFGKNYGKAIAVETTTELLQEITTIVGSDIANMYDKSAYQSKFLTEEGRSEIATRLADVFEATVKAMILLGAPGAAVNFRSDYKLAKEAERQTKFFESLGDAAESSKLRERSPDAFHNLISQQAAANGVENVYVDGERFAQSMIDAGVTVDQLRQVLPGVVDQISEAVRIGEDIVIPTADYATYVAGTKFGQSLLPHVRADINAISAAEAVEFENQKKALLDAAVAKVEEKKAADKVFAESATKVQQQFEQQIAGATTIYTPQQLKREAMLMSRMYEVMAERMGILPEQAYEMYPITIGAEGQAVFSQQADLTTPEFKRWFGESKVVDAQGKPLRVFHTGAFDSDVIKSGSQIAREQGKDFPANQNAIYFSKSPTYSSAYGAGKPGATMYPVYLSIQNPLVIKNEKQMTELEKAQKSYSQFTGNNAPTLDGITGDTSATMFITPEYLQQLKELGYDGIINEVIDEIAVFDSNQIKSVFNERPTNDPSILKQAATLRSGKETLKKFGLDPNGTYKTREIAAALEARQRAKYGKIEADDRSDVALQKIAKWMMQEVEFEMDNPEKSGVGWYSEKFQRALDIMAEQFPELATDQNARNTMTALIAITSDGQKVVPNFAQAMDIYGNFREGGATPGQFTTTRGHQRQKSIDSNLQNLQRLYDSMGVEAMHEYLMQERTISELKKIAKENGGDMKSDYQAHIKMPMAAIEFGPKLGAFYANLMGAHGYLTMDRWWSRTFNRYRGTLITAPTRQGLDRFKDLIGKPNISDDEAIAATVEYRKSYEAKDFKNGTEIEKAANTIWKAAFDALEDAPFNAKDRTFMLDAVNKAQQMLAKKGYDLSVADIQAILWYYEKRLYGELGARQTADISYEEAAQRVVAGYAAGSGEQSLYNESGELREDEGAVEGGVSPGEDVFDAAAPLRQSGLDLEEQSRLISEAAAGRLTQTDRGGFNPRDLSIVLTKDADYSTLHHETMHAIIEIYARIASSENAPATITEDFQKLMDFVGIADVTAWNAMSLEEQRPYHEALASAHELWFFEGKAPSVELQPVFDRISAWMRKIYNYVATTINDLYKQNYGRDLPILNDEVRSVFARMYASEEQVSQAEQVRNMMPMFQTQEESGMDDATWQAYQELYQEAHDAAVTDLTKASLRNMRWLSNARSRILKELQKAADAQRKEVRAEVAAEVENEPVYLAMKFLKRGQVMAPDGTEIEAAAGHKLSIEAVKALYPESAETLTPAPDISKLGHGKYGMLAKEGLAPDLVADMFGFPSGDALVRSLIDAKPINEEIQARTDARMEAEYGDMTDEREIQLKVEEALHNEARARFVAAELRFLNKSTQPVRVMMQAARQAARDILAGKPIKEIRRRDYSLAEARAAKQTEKHMKKGEAVLAAKSKQNQLVQNQLAAEAIKARQEVEKGVESFKKFFKSDEKMAKNRNMDLVDAARSILAYYGLGQKGKAPTEYIEKLRTYNPDLYAELEPLIIDAATGAKDYTQLTMTEFRLMKEAVETLWFQSKREKEVMIEGNAIALEQVTGELNARLAAIGIPLQVAGERAAPSKKDRAIRAFYEAKAATRRVEHWANATDGPKGVGPFTTYIWRPIRQALDAYRQMRNKYTKQYVDSIGKLELPVAKIEAPELGYTFGNGNGGIGKAELLGAILHTGNESNYRKLLLGRGWAVELEDGTLDDSNWRKFEARMIAEGKLTKADYDWAQSVWDLNEELKPMAQKAHHDLYGYYFKEVPATQVANALGVWRGGYVPAKTDPFIVRDAQKQAKMEELESDFRNAMPSTGMGFTKARVEYNKPLSLDIRVMAKHIDDVIRFINVQPAVKDVLKILRNREFADNISRQDPSVIEDMLLPWLNRAARQITSESGKHKAVDAFWRGVRSRTGISIMFANITNALQQVTGYFPAMLKTDAKYLRGALGKYVFSPTATAEEVAEMSPFMADRLQNQMIEIQEMMNDLVLNPSKFDKVQKWASHHGYFLQQAFQNQVDVVTWVATFNKTLAELGAQTSDQAAVREAVQQADAAVRMTQSSLAAEDIAAFEVGTPFYRTFIQFSGYFNMLANLNADEYVKVFRDMGWRGNKGKLAMIYVLGFMLPMVLSDAIVRTMGGQWDDEDDDGYLDEVMEWFFGSQLRGAVALIPGFGTGVAAVINAFNDKPYDDRMATSPAVSALEGATVGVVKAGMNLVDESKQVTGKNVRDVLTLLSLVTGIPLTVLGRPIGYEMEVERGKITPSDTMDYIRGLVTGKASEASRQ